jgi:serine/threonine protein kinase
MLLTDYSKDATGEPSTDPDDGVVYVITELAQYSLKDYLALRREQNRPLPKESVKSITKAVILVVAGLHAKGLAHLDLKPENLMMFNGRLKLIDVDGCVKINTNVSITDSSISFSPCYCAPEWAQFLINESNSGIMVAPALDVWSVGMTICEFVSLNAILKPMYGNFLRNAHSHREAGFLFMDWLSNIKKVPLPKQVEKFDADFVDLVSNWLLVCDKATRKSCAQSMSHPYVVSAAGKKDKEVKAEDMGMHEKAEEVTRTNRHRSEDTSNTAPLYKGTLWKLNTGGDVKDATHWLKRDMWIAQAGSLCYFSVKENKRLVLVDASKLAGCNVKKVPGGAKPYAFELTYKSEHDDDKAESAIFACESEEELRGSILCSVAASNECAGGRNARL